MPKASRPPESTSESAWALDLPRTQPDLEVCPRTQDIQRPLERVLVPPYLLHWAGDLGVMLDGPKAPCILVRGAERERERDSNQAEAMIYL